MAANVIDTLKIVFGADTKEIENGMRHVEQTLEGGLQNILSNFVAPLAAAFAGAQLFGDYTAQADAIGKMSVALGVDGEALQAWGEAAARAGGSAQGLQGSVRSLNRGIQEFARTGKGRAAESLKALGFNQKSVKDAQGNAKDVFSLMQMLSEKAESMDKAKFAGIAERLGLDQGTIMLLQSGRVAVDELVARQKSLGVYTEKDFEITAAFNDAIADLGQVFKAVAAVVMRVITPVITKIAGWLTDGMMFIRQHEPLIIAFFFAIAAAITAKLMPAIMLATKTFLKTGAKIMLSPWGAIAALIAGIAIALDDLYAYLDGGDSQFADLWAQFGSAERIKETLETVWQGLKDVFNALFEAGERLSPVLSALFLGFVEAVILAAKGVSALTEKLLILWDAMSPDAEKVWAGIVEGLGIMADAYNDAGGGFEGLIAVMKLLWENFCLVAKQAWDDFSEYIKARFRQAWDNISANINAVWVDITSYIKDAVTNAVIWFKELYNDIAGIFGNVANIFNPVAEALSGLADWLADIFTGVFSTIRTAGSVAADALSNLFSAAVNAVAGAFRWVADIAQGIFSRLFSSFESAADLIIEAGAGIVEYLAGAFDSAFEFIANIFSGAVNVFSDIGDTIRNIWDGICNFFMDAWSNAINWISNKFLGFVESAKGMWNDVKSFFGFGDDSAPEPVSVGSRGNNSRIDFSQPEQPAQPVQLSAGAKTQPAQPSPLSAGAKTQPVQPVQPNTAKDIQSLNRQRERGTYTAPARRNQQRGASAPADGNIRVLPVSYPAGQAAAPSKVENVTRVNNDTQVNVSKIEVTTQATDAAGIAAGIGTATVNDFKSRDLVVTLDSGVYK